VGLKPTYGRCSRFGCIAFASSLDTPGPATRNITDTAIMLQAMAGFDAQDSTSVNVPVPNYRAALTGNIKGLKVGIPREYKIDGINPEVQKMWAQTCDWLRQAGAEIVDISLPHTAHALPCYYVLAPAEASSNLSRYDGMRYGLRVEGKDLNDTYERSRGAGFGEEVKKRILVGTYVLSAGYFDAYYIKAQKIRRLIQQDFIEAYKKVDVILTPATPGAAFGPDDKDGDPIAIYLEDVFTVTANLAGVPGLAVPAGLNSQGLPMGVQLLGKPFDEATLLNAGLVIEQAAQFSAEPDYEWYKGK
jgi:aspartyl-tRNA(Asn)/glutamyl-tRNA(Gln) amidotransferase subunit A